MFIESEKLRWFDVNKLRFVIYENSNNEDFCMYFVFMLLCKIVTYLLINTACIYTHLNINYINNTLNSRELKKGLSNDIFCVQNLPRN